MPTKIAVVLIYFLFLLVFHSCRENTNNDKSSVPQKEEIIKKKQEVSNTDMVKKKYEKLLIGSWLDTSDAALHFTILQNGVARSDNMATLLYQKWRVKDNKVIFTIKSIGNHTSSISEDIYDIIELKNEIMILKSGNFTMKCYRRHPSTNIETGQKITSPLKIKVNSEGVWFASEGELGTVEIIDDHNNILNLKDDWGILSSVDGNWMNSKPAKFQTIVKFDSKGAKKGKIIFYSDPGEGDGDEAGITHTFEIPIVF